MQEHQLKPNRDSSAIAYVDEMNPYGTHWDWTYFPPSYCTQRLKQRKISYCTQRLKQRKINKGKQSKDTLQIEIKASHNQGQSNIFLNHIQNYSNLVKCSDGNV